MEIFGNSSTTQAGKTTGVILIHGLTGTPVEMKPLEKYLKKLGLDVESVLLAGHGAGHEEVTASTWTEWISSARQGMQAMLEKHDRVIICGLSMGAVIGSILAGEEKRVSGLVMLSPTLRYDGSVLLNSMFDWIYHSDVVTRSMAFFCRLMPVVGKKFYWEELPPYGIRDERIQRQITKSIEAAKISGSNDFGSFRTYYKSLADMVDLVDYASLRFSRVTCPTLLMYSMDDTLASLNNASRCYLEIGAVNKALVTMTGCDHVMTLDLQRHLVHKMVGRFTQNFAMNDPEHASVRSLISPVLSESRFANGANITATISPETHGLNKDEWQEVYPERRYVNPVAATNVNQVHSITVRDRSQAILSLPIFLGENLRVAGDQGSAFVAAVSRFLPSGRNSVLGIGSMSRDIPGLGVNEDSSIHSRATGITKINRLIRSLAVSAKVNAFSSVMELRSVPLLPAPSVMRRASDESPIPLHEPVHKLVSGLDTFYHCNPLYNALSRIAQSALPSLNETRSESLVLEEAAVG